MQGNEPAERPILYIGYWSRALRRRRFEGIRRYAKSRGWGVVPVLSSEVPDVPSLRAVLARHRPVGVIAECAGSPPAFPPRAFGDVPVVYFDPPERAAWRGAAFVACDEEAVVRAAFLELAAGRPPAYAMVSSLSARPPRWARERDAAFRSLCATAGKQCLVFQPKIGETPEARARRLVSWVAALPQRCAVFAIDDYRAEEATRAFAAARRSLPRTATLVGANGVGATEGAGDFPVSTVEIDFELSGYLAARLLGASGDGPSAPAPLFGPILVRHGKTTLGHGRREPWVLEAVEAIRRDACNGLTAGGLIARFPVSKRLFNLRFREAMGHTVHDEIAQVRMERVFSLLSDTDTPVGVVADMCGFGSAVELRQVFKARTRMSMTAWRNLHRR